jgi:hypothetical protein
MLHSNVYRETGYLAEVLSLSFKFSSVHLDRCPDGTLIKPLPLPSKSFPFHYLSIFEETVPAGSLKTLETFFLGRRVSSTLKMETAGSSKILVTF